MIIRSLTPTPAALGCTNCPGAGNCSKPAALAGLGCSCSDCPSASTCAGRQGLGFALSTPSVSIDWADPKVWIIVAFAAALVYQMFFSSDKRAKRSARRSDLRSAREKYSNQVRQIKESYA